MRTFRSISAFALIICAGITPAGDDLPLRKSDAKQQLLVLNNGNVAKGQLTRRTGGYDVALNPGRMFIGDEQIRFQAVNMEDAYFKMRASIQNLTPTKHVELARWCVNNNLPSQARQELLDALHLNNEHADARLMLEGLTREETRAKRQQRQIEESEKSAKLAESIAFRNTLPERRSLGGLPRPLAVTFTRRIQPLLSNKCGNARCHSNGRRQFSIVSVKNGSSAVIAEQNLAAILNNIDLGNPQASPLLRATSGLHGGSRHLLFPGETGREQLQLLRLWISEVAKEIGPAERPAEGQVSVVKPATRPDVLQAAWNIDGDHTANSAGTALTATHGTERNRDKSAKRLMREAAIATRHDEFDPDVFNRRFHGRTRLRGQPTN